MSLNKELEVVRIFVAGLIANCRDWLEIIPCSACEEEEKCDLWLIYNFIEDLQSGKEKVDEI